MAFAMARPVKRIGSSFFQSRQRIPTDLLDRVGGVQLSIPVGNERLTKVLRPGATHVAVSLRTRDPRERNARHAEVTAYLASVWEGLRRGTAWLSHRQVVALAGEFYRETVGAQSDSPGEPSIWDEVVRLTAGKTADPITLEQWLGASADDLLSRKGLVVDEDSRARLLAEIGRSLVEAAETLKRNAEGDYRPDQTASRFPAWETGERFPQQPRRSGVENAITASITELIEGWWREAQAAHTSPSTRQSYSGALRRFVEFIGHDDATRVTPEDVIRYKDFRLQQVNPRTGRANSAKTVHATDLAALKTIFKWAVVNRRMARNPASGIGVKVGRKAISRPKGFTDEEAAAILGAASAHVATPREGHHTAAAKRWIPWLCAHTGARVGEMVQLRKRDVILEGGVWTLVITPDAGTVKTGKVRRIPLHPQLVEMGFPEFAARARGEYLFSASRPDHRGGPRNRLREWVRSIITDTRVQPNHGWRHRFITKAREAGVDQEKRRMITGHSGEGTDELVYGDPAGLYREICKIPHIQVT